MVKNNLRKSRKINVTLWITLLVILLIGVAAATAFAQDGELDFAPDKNRPESISAPMATAVIPVSRDSFVSSKNPNINYGFDSFVRFGSMPSGLGATRPLFYFDLRPYIPLSAKIRKAEFQVYLLSISPAGDCGRGYAANYIAQTWSEGAVSWNNMPQWGAEFARGSLGCSGGWQKTEVTDLAREWLRNPGGNNGVILIGDERPDQSFERAYYSRNANNGLYPRLYVEYDNYNDTTPPVARVTQPSPPGTWEPANFVVKWEGSDPNNPDGSPGSGIRWYDVYYSLDKGYKWIIGRAQVTSTETQAIGAQHLQRYDFYARARDNAGNEGPAPSSGSSQTWVTIDAEAPQATMNQLPTFTSTTSFMVSWQDTKEAKESGIASYDIQWREEGGPWNILVYGTKATSTNFPYGQNGMAYEFRARGTDNVGNVQEFGDPQAATVVWLTPLAFVVPFDPQVYQKLDGPEADDKFTVTWEGLSPPGTSIASFDLRYRRPGNSTWLSWKSGTQQTSAPFNLKIDDPDGTYIFQARARNSEGILGPYLDELEGRIIVDRFPPFIEERYRLPIIFSTD